MQQSVIFGILLTLLNKKRVTRQQLAEKFEISLRTVARYLDVLLCSNIPVRGITGKEGGVYIEEDYCLERGFFTINERERLIKCVESMANTFQDITQELVIQKLLDANIREYEEQKILKTEAIYIDNSGLINPQFYKKKLNTFNDAIINTQKVSFNYSDKYTTTNSRIVHPYTLVLKESAWHLYAFCESTDDFGLFRMSRITNIHVNKEQQFEKRMDANLATVLTNSSPQVPDVNLVIEFNNLLKPDIEDWLGVDTIKQKGLLYIASTTIAGGQKLLSKLLFFGSDVKVLSPNSIIEELRTESKRILSIYEKNKT